MTGSLVNILNVLAYLRLTSAQKFAVRKKVVLRVKAGESVEPIARTLPFTARTIYRWIARFSLGGFNNLKDRKKTGRPRKWTDQHAEWIYKTVVDKTPKQCKFEFALWTATDSAKPSIRNSACESVSGRCAASYA